MNLDMAGLAVDLTPVGGMENLDHLRIGDDWNSHRISLDLAPLSGLTGLKYLHVLGAKVDNVEAISSMSGLICINLQNCGLTSAKLTALNGHPLTTEINLERNAGWAGLIDAAAAEGNRPRRQRHQRLLDV